ncbi:phosphate starvation-inducible protein PhoH [Rhodothalassium salexigens]|uniref:PhoH family protein n=2 Tax=Rhodothalassium salexigens TaxID=1086 RepID=UPI00191432B4|nr:PhoH family protein [Rhodothalassium salexigens]MBK5921855.1 phosphate starvation-inducible protein PhoH [Rhodothalassium salexigens]
MHDQNLARIEQALGVTILSRGNRVLVRGPDDRCRAAQAALGDLYRRLEDGQVIDLGDVDGAVRMARADAKRTAATPPPTATPPTAPTAQGRGDGRAKSRSARKAKRPTAVDMAAQGEPDAPTAVRIETKSRTIMPRSPAQAEYIAALKANELVFGVGPAGTGKTYLAVAMGVALLVRGEVERIILSRPAVEAGENLGYLPGDMKEKVDPYLRPLYDALYDSMPPEQVERRLASGQIEVAPLAFMRGRTLKNAFVILDEAQNTTPVQMKMFLTRFGENSRMVVCGDPSQVDLGPRVQSGLHHALDTLKSVQGVAIVRFSQQDVVRHALVGRIVQAYDRADKAGPARPATADLDPKPDNPR